MIGQAVGAYTDATHGMTLSAVALPYYRHILPSGLPKFKRYAQTVWNVDPAGKTDEEVAYEGLARMEDWMREIGVVLNVGILGVTEAMVEDIAQTALIKEGGYKVLTHSEIAAILRESLGR